ncbi:hypothetical protein K7X08_004396 [Anisodus acutangulus]|uniref:RRM domain-containing protein n=1 Tax=Anisodus acutangulus TaxID=402998 RepID=A0A9Q1RHE4_9SOLA|nr:hypothetical protein K7X08_004396 [Anisodus acutangulus]
MESQVNPSLVLIKKIPLSKLKAQPHSHRDWRTALESGRTRHNPLSSFIIRVMAAIAVLPSASLYAKSQLSLSSSIRKESKYLLPSQPLSQHFSSSLLILRYSQIVSCYPQTRFNFNPSTKLFVSGLSFRTTEESLKDAFKNFGELVEVNLMIDKIANRPRGFAFLRYATEEESQKAIEGMHGKFLDGRVIFVEVAKPRSELRRGPNHNSRE